MTTGANDFTTVGAACTTKVATLLGVPGVGNPVYEAPEDWLLLVPATLLVTEIIIVQPVVGTLPAVTAKLDTPTAALLATAVQVPVTVAEDIVMPAGNVSVKARPVIAAPVGLEIVNVICDVPPLTMVVGANAFAIPNLATVSVAVAAAPTCAGPVETTVDVVLT